MTEIAGFCHTGWPPHCQGFQNGSRPNQPPAIRVESGTRLVVEGVVLSTACTPIPGALIDFWQADDRGEYDNSGYRLRGH